MNPLPVPAVSAFVSVLALIPSCTNSSHLLLYQHSTMGLNTGVNPATQAVHARVGIRREFGAIVPKYVKAASDDQKKDKNGDPIPEFEAASAYFGSRFRVSSIWKVPEAAEVLATGQAAVLAASNGRLRLSGNHDTLSTNTASSNDGTPPAIQEPDPAKEVAAIETPKS